MEEVERASDGLLDRVGNGLIELAEAFGQAEVAHVSIVVLAILVLLICFIAQLIDDLPEQNPPTLTAGVLKFVS